MSVGIRVENLPGDAREETLVDLLSGYDNVRVVRLVRSGVALNATSRGLVMLGDRKDAARAVQALNGQFCRGRLLHVEPVQVDS